MFRSITEHISFRRTPDLERHDGPPIAYVYPYQYDPAYVVSPNRSAIERVNLPGITEAAASEAVRQLCITWPLRITTTIPPPLEWEPRRKHIIPMTGTAGAALSATDIELYFDPDLAVTVGSLVRYRRGEVAHELTHAARWRTVGPGRTLGDRVISEGLATWVQEHFGPTPESTPWGHALTPREEAFEWERLTLERGEYDYDRTAWFFDHDSVVHPMWSGYSIGTAIVDSFFRANPDVSVAQAVRLDTNDIFAASGYVPPHG